MRMGRALEEFDLVWIEEPLDAYDAEGHAQLARALDTSIATGEMLASVAEHVELIERRRGRHHPAGRPPHRRHHPVPQARRPGRVHSSLQLAPHFAMEIHLHLAAAYPHEPWVEHFDWLDPLFNERLETRDGRMYVSDRPGLGFTLSEQARAWTVDRVHVDASR